MKSQDKLKWGKRVLWMVLVPVLAAAVLLAVADRMAASSERKYRNSPKASAGVNENDAGRGIGAEADPAGENGSDGPTGEEGADASEGAVDPGLSADTYDPVQELSFTLKKESIQQRSIPVRIDASILGGAAGTNCWAVFLPAEMASAPRIVFSEFKKVSLEPLEDWERLGTGRLGPDEDDVETAGQEDQSEYGGMGDGGLSGDPGESGAGEYASGDLVKGLTNGSAFRVKMTWKEDTADRNSGNSTMDSAAESNTEETILYFFSCTGTATMYLDTESGSMEKVDGDPTKETSEEADFFICRSDGTADSSGKCTVSGRGNSTWQMMKRPYNINLEEKTSVLGMKECRKLCLLANTFDFSNLLNRISSQLALSLEMRDTPEGEFVNLYLNGRYNGLYYLSQRPRTGGSVNIKKLDDKILQVNGFYSGESDEEGEEGGNKDKGNGVNGKGENGTEKEGSQNTGSSRSYSGQIPKRIALHEEGERQKRWAYNWPNEPRNNTGGYLLQQYSRYEGDGCWFSTVHRRFRIMSPDYPTVGQVNYLYDYMMAAERAIYSEDGKDPETGRHYSTYLDLDSWEDMCLLEEYFAEWDAERWSFYIIKDRDDPFLYCGPMWDFDHSAGLMIYGTYPETAVSMLLFRDTRHGWLYKLLSHEEFVRELHSRWTERFSPAVHDYLDKRMEKEIRAIESAAYMNNIRRGNNIDFRSKAEELRIWLTRRLAFLDDFCGTEDGKKGEAKYCRVEYQFTWGSLSHYVPRGEKLGYLPLPEYGEFQISSQVEKNEIIGWQDENGKKIKPDIVIDRDRVFTPVYR